MKIRFSPHDMEYTTSSLLGCNGSHNKFTSIHKALNVTIIE